MIALVGTRHLQSAFGILERAFCDILGRCCFENDLRQLGPLGQDMPDECASPQQFYAFVPRVKVLLLRLQRRGR